MSERSQLAETRELVTGS
jgi:hypothetical protein